MHHDHGAQYTSKDYAALCRRLGVNLSMGAVGSSADNALAESWNASMKHETLRGAAAWATERDARMAVFRWVNRHNNVRRHSRCGYQPPATFEARSTPATFEPAPRPATLPTAA